MGHPSLDAADGYYYKDSTGRTHGPLAKDEFDLAQIKGVLKPGMKAWRQKAGSYFQVKLQRRYTIGRIVSITSIGYTCELTMILFSLAMLVYIFRSPKLQMELHHKVR